MFRFQKIALKRVLTLDECRDLLLRLRTEFPIEYKLYNLENITLNNILSVLKLHFANWKPLDIEQVNYGVNVFKEWREILTEDIGTSGEKSMFNHFNESGFCKKNILIYFFNLDLSISSYDQCIWEALMPPIQRATLNWSARDNGPAMMSFIETWIPLLPKWIAENILEQVSVK